MPLLEGHVMCAPSPAGLKAQAMDAPVEEGLIFGHGDLAGEQKRRSRPQGGALAQLHVLLLKLNARRRCPHLPPKRVLQPVQTTRDMNFHILKEERQSGVKGAWRAREGWVWGER